MPRKAPRRIRPEDDTSLPIEAIDRIDGSVWKVRLLKQVDDTTWYVRWVCEIAHKVEDTSGVFDEELSTRDMRPESIGCSEKDCLERKLKEGVPVAAFISPPPEFRHDPAVPSSAWYDGIIIKAEPRSHSFPRTNGKPYTECHCYYNIRFTPEIDTTEAERPTFVKRVQGTRKLAFLRYADGPISDVVSGKIRKDDFKQSWEPEFRVDVSQFPLDGEADPAQNVVRRNERNQRTDPLPADENLTLVLACPAPPTRAGGGDGGFRDPSFRPSIGREDAAETESVLKDVSMDHVGDSFRPGGWEGGSLSDEDIGGVMGEKSQGFGESHAEPTWLRCDSESGDKTEYGAMGGNKRKLAENDKMPNKRNKVTGVGGFGSEELSVVTADWWAVLEAAEERAKAAGRRRDEPRGLEGLDGRVTRSTGPSLRSLERKSKVLQARGLKKIGGVKGVGLRQTKKVADRKKLKKESVVPFKRRKIQWSDSDDEDGGKVGASGGDGQDPVMTAWEQCDMMKSERAMREALAQTPRARSEEANVGSKCELEAHPLRQDSDGMYCQQCRCFVRQLTEADLPRQKPATDEGWPLFLTPVKKPKPSAPTKLKKEDGTRPAKKVEGMKPQVGEEREDSGVVRETTNGEEYLRGRMKPHQREAFDFARKALVGDAKKGGEEGGAILWLSPGLGKTLVALSVIEHLRWRERLCPLIIAPASIQEVWVAEIQKWFTGKPGRPRRLVVYRVDETSLDHAAALKRREEKLERRECGAATNARACALEEEEEELDGKRLQTVLTWQAKKGGPLLISYEQHRRSAGAGEGRTRVQEELRELLLSVPNLVILDEGHVNRNPATQTFQVLNRLKTARRLLLTGTFVNNDSLEIYNMARFARARDVMHWGRQRTVVERTKRKTEQSSTTKRPRTPRKKPSKEEGSLKATPQPGTADLPAKPKTVGGIPPEGPEPEEPAVKEKFLAAIGRPVEKWIKGTGGKAEGESALDELTSLVAPFLHIGGEEKLSEVGVPERNDFLVKLKLSGTALELHERFIDLVIGRTKYEERIGRRHRGGDTCPPPVKKPRSGSATCPRLLDGREKKEGPSRGKVCGEIPESSDEEEGGHVAGGRRDDAIGEQIELLYLCAHPAAYFKKADSGKSAIPAGLERYRERFAGPVEPTDSPKLQFVIDLLRVCKASGEQTGRGEKTLVFSYYTKPLEVFMQGVRTALGWEDRELCYIHGGLPFKERMKIVERFQSEGGPRVLFATIKACGQGLTINQASRVVLLEPNWNPTLIFQALHRAVRIGQTRSVSIYRLVCQGTYEDVVIYRASLEKDRLGHIIARAFSERARARARAQECAHAGAETPPGARAESSPNSPPPEVVKGKRSIRRKRQGEVEQKRGEESKRVSGGGEITDQFLLGFVEKWGVELVAETHDYKKLLAGEEF